MLCKGIRSRTPGKRKYDMRRRLETIDAMRDRITRATFELHATVGPAKTTISAVAERAGVQRHTVYRHFPEPVDLIRACSAHSLQVTNPPDPAVWRSIGPPRRLEVGLDQLYAYFRANDRLLGNIVRDMAVMPELVAGTALNRARTEELREVLVESLDAPTATQRALVGHATDYSTWRSLTSKGLSDAEARDAMVRLVRVSLPAG
jgi:AcrR family transcriptional regulator